MEGEWPHNFTRTVFISLEKKANTMKCEEHETISLIAHASKVLLKILTHQIESKAEYFLGDDQCGVKRGRGTRQAIVIMRLLGERIIENGQKVYACFVDNEKAFD